MGNKAVKADKDVKVGKDAKAGKYYDGYQAGASMGYIGDPTYQLYVKGGIPVDPIKDHIGPGESLAEHEFIVDKINQFTAVMQADGNFVVYLGGCRGGKKHDYSAKMAIWSTDTHGQGKGPYKCVMELDNNLVVYDGEGKVLWTSDSKGLGKPGGRLVLRNPKEHCLQIWDGDGKAVKGVYQKCGLKLKK
eukprot:161553_1